MEICGRQFITGLVQRLQERLDSEAGGRARRCRIRCAGVIDGPRGEAFPAPRRPRRGAGVRKAGVESSLAELQPVEVVPVGSADSRTARTWNELLERYHPHGAGPLCGV